MKKNNKNIDIYKLSDEEYYYRYYNSPSLWLVEQTDLFYDIYRNKIMQPYNLQKKVIDESLNYLLTVILKVRQAGISTSMAGQFAHQAMFGKTEGGLFLSTTMKQAIVIMEKFYLCFDTIIDTRFKPYFKKRSVFECKFQNGIKQLSLPSRSVESCRGFTGNMFFDEFGSFNSPNDMELWAAVAPSMAAKDDLRIVIASTPGLVKNLFHDFCTKTLAEIAGLPEKEMVNPNTGEIIKKNMITIRWQDVPHIRDNYNLICSRLPKEVRECEIELKFKENEESTLFPYQFLSQNAFGENEEIIPLDLDLLFNNDNINFLKY